MLSKITWQEYLFIVAAILVFYYAVLGLKYYRPQVIQIMSRKLDGRSFFSKQSAEADMNELEDVARDLRYAVLEKAGPSTDKQQLLLAIQMRLKYYPGMKKPAFRVAMNNYIMLHAKEICGIEFSEAELNTAWQEI
jgi:hypothetical protein